MRNKLTKYNHDENQHIILSKAYSMGSLPRKFTVRTTPIKGHPTNPTCFIPDIPSPRSNSMPSTFDKRE